MDGARRHDPPPPHDGPPPEVVHPIHDRYLWEVVEGLGLCPFARYSREQGHVHRPLVYGAPPSAADAAAALRQALDSDPAAEIVLITFIGPALESPWPRARDFDRFVKDVRSAYDPPEPLFFMVGFHPRSGGVDPGEDPPPLTRDSLVPLIRRTPDPVIQCVRGETLQQARATAQRKAHARMLEETTDPRLRAILERSVLPDSVLSADIAEGNFDAVGTGEGRRRLDETIADIQDARDQAYARWASTSSS